MGSYKKNIASNFIIQIAKIILTFITSILIARVLEPGGKGYVAYVVLIFVLLGIYGHLGINNASIYFQKKSKYDEETIYNTNITYLIIIWICISIIIITLKCLNLFLKDYSLFFIIFGLLSVLFSFIITCINSFYIGNEKISEANKYFLICLIVYSCIIIFLYFINLLNIYSYFALYTVMPIFNIIMLAKNINFKYKFSIRLDLLKKEFKFGIIIYFSALFIDLNYRIDQIMIKNMMGNTDLGIYTIGVNLAELLFLVPNSVTTALLAKLYNVDDILDKKKITTKTIKYTFYISLILCFVGILMTPLIPIVYGKQYYRSIYVTIILFAGVIFASIGKVSYSYFFAEGRPKVHLIITFITLVINIIFNSILIPNIGINGAAIASTISYTLYGVIYIMYFIKNGGFRLKDFFLFDNYDKKIIKQFINSKKIFFRRKENEYKIKK